MMLCCRQATFKYTLVLLAIVLGMSAAALLFVHNGPLVAPGTDASPCAVAADHTYWTWDTMEFDKCAAAWMIRRFADKEAVFQFHSQGETEI